jgi:hypothetical protein
MQPGVESGCWIRCKGLIHWQRVVQAEMRTTLHRLVNRSERCFDLLGHKINLPSLESGLSVSKYSSRAIMIEFQERAKNRG